MNEQLSFLSGIQNKPMDIWCAAAGGYWHNRIVTELLFCTKLSNEIKEQKYNDLLSQAITRLRQYLAENGAITKQIVLALEDSLKELSPVVKAYKVLFAAHAHIDMNWMWGTAETVAITLDTFRTMLQLMREYEDFTFSQSQASVYEIVEKYAPEMLEEIKIRVAEKRWEVTATTWVETDKNLPNGESLSRHILYTKQYLNRLLDIAPEDLTIDFEPDTFGHNINVPEILAQGGVKYYYHCRGYEGHNLYRYKSPSGSEVLVYREPQWYNGAVDSSHLVDKIAFYKQCGVKTALSVYGVGDHGGGPTRRDIENILDMKSWPLLPTVSFGSYKEFFAEMEAYRHALPVVDKELNFIFDGCYTSQSRIKAANRIGENRLYQAEALSAFSAVFAGGGYNTQYFAQGWKNILFNHFHDILPGSGVVDTREAALGLFQDTLARTNTSMGNAMRTIAATIDTASLLPAEDTCASISEGAGVGYGVTDFVIPATERGKGSGRIFHVFNSTAFEKTSVVPVTVWDWPGQRESIGVYDVGGNPLAFQIIGHADFEQDGSYWGHEFVNLLVEIRQPAFGYNTFLVKKRAFETSSQSNDPRLIEPPVYRLENDCIAVEFDPVSMEIDAITEKSTGHIRPVHGGLRVVLEDPAKGMTAWCVGRYKKILPLEEVNILETCLAQDALRQWIKFEAKVCDSKLTVTVFLEKGQPALQYHLVVDWFEKGQADTAIPQLQFAVSADYAVQNYCYDVPFGVIQRPGINIDVPAQSFVCAINQDADSLAIFAKTKYGFRGDNNSLAVSLLRSSFDPDPYPEIGVHKMEFCLGLVSTKQNSTLLRHSIEYNYPPVAVSGSVHSGTAPTAYSFIERIDSVIVSAIKMAEHTDGQTLILRVYEPDGQNGTHTIALARPVKAAWFADLMENPIEGTVEVLGSSLRFSLDAYCVATIAIEF